MKRPNKQEVTRGSLTRQAGQRAARSKVIGVAYDGIRTEAEYVKGWARALGPRGIALTPYFVKSGGNAKEAITAAITKLNRDGDIDEKWCICDVDDTSAEDMAEALQLAASSDINLCLSTRSFEVWIALHWEKISTAPVSNEKEAIALVRKHYGKYGTDGKWIPFSQLLERSEQACINAKWLRKQSVPNPHTDMDKLVEKLIEYSKS